jgi:hypothetical protein
LRRGIINLKALNYIKRYFSLLVITVSIFCLSATAGKSTCSIKNQHVANPSPKGKVILAIFAHPDDEEWVAPVLAKYAEEGVSVYLVVATDGRFGVTPHAKIPAGDSWRR